MRRLLYFNYNVALRPEARQQPGMEKYFFFFKHMYPATIALVDRTGTFRAPIATKSLFPIPALRPMHSTFEELCDARAAELLARADARGAALYVMWSGGIDSTLILVSLLKNATPEQKRNIVVLMSENSINENPNFYRDHVHGALRTESANGFPLLLGTDRIVIGGEGNDQLFGSDVVGKVIQRFGTDFMHAPYSRDLFFSFFSSGTEQPELVHFYLDLFERLRDASPVPIETNYDQFWWINFTLKWQNVYMRLLPFIAPRNVANVAEGFGITYDHFFATDDFQIWSMQNPDKKIKDSWKSYKWVCKDIIYDYTKDADYRDNKLKIGSLKAIIVQRAPFNYIDEDFAFSYEMPTEEYYASENDFR